MSNLNEWAYTEEELAQLEEERDLNNDITIEVEIDNSTKAMKAMETQYDDLSRVFKNIKEAKGINRSLAAEAADVLPNFNGGKSLRSYSTVATMEGYRAALEEINLGMAAAIAGIVAAVAALIVKFISWITGGDSSDGKFTKGSFKAKKEEKAETIKDVAPKAMTVYEVIDDSLKNGIPLVKDDKKGVVKSIEDIFEFVGEVNGTGSVSGVYEDGSIKVADVGLRTIFEDIESNGSKIISSLLKADDLNDLMNASFLTDKAVKDNAAKASNFPEEQRSDYIRAIYKKSSARLRDGLPKLDEVKNEVEKFRKVKNSTDKKYKKMPFTKYVELLKTKEDFLLKAYLSSAVIIDDCLVRLNSFRDNLLEEEKRNKEVLENLDEGQDAQKEAANAVSEYIRIQKSFITKLLGIANAYNSFIIAIEHSYSFVLEVMTKAEELMDKYVDKDENGAELVETIKKERQQHFNSHNSIKSVIGKLKNK